MWLVSSCFLLVLLLASACYWLFFFFADIPYPDGPPPATATPTQARVTGALVRETFDVTETSRLGTRDDAQARFSIEAGTYVMETRRANTTAWSVIGDRFADVAVSADCVQNGPGSAAGIVFRYRDTANFYLFQVAAEGYYSLDLLNNNAWVTLIDWTYDEAIAASGQTNQLRIETRDDRIALFVNEQVLEETSDASWTGGDAGLAISTFESAGGLLRCDNLTITSI